MRVDRGNGPDGDASSTGSNDSRVQFDYPAHPQQAVDQFQRAWYADMCRIFWSSYSSFIQPTVVSQTIWCPRPGLLFSVPSAHEKQMGAPDGAGTTCAFGDSHLALPPPKGGGVSALMRAEP